MGELAMSSTDWKGTASETSKEVAGELRVYQWEKRYGTNNVECFK